MQGVQMEMDWQRLYSADVWREGGSEEVSILVFIDRTSEDAMINPEHPSVLMPIVECLSNAGEDVLDVRYRGSEDVY